MTPAIFSKSLNLLKSLSPRLASRLSFIDEADSRIQVENSTTKLLSDDSAIICDTFPSILTTPITKPSKPVIIHYGVGLGSELLNLKAWLDASPNHHIVALDDDLEAIYWFLHTPIALDLLKHERFQLFDLVPGDLTNPFDMIYWRFFNHQTEFVYLPAYVNIRKTSIEKLRNKFLQDNDSKKVLQAEYEDASKEIYRHLYHNLFALDGAVPIAKLEGKAKGIPAIICGAGPSLERYYDLLPELKNRALILAGGSSINALNAHGITPHFGFGVDPNSIQVERVLHQTSFTTPFFFRSRWHHQALKAMPGKKVYINGSGDNLACEWFENHFNIDPVDLDGGFNVINLAISSAIYMGCSPILLIGMDLSFTNNKLYSKGISGKQELSDHHNQENFLEANDLNGEPIFTKPCWIREATWISKQAYKYPNIKFINATGGGMPIEGIESIEPLELLSYLTQKYDMDGFSHHLLSQETLDIPKDIVVSAIDVLKNSLDHSSKLIDKLTLECLKSKEEIQNSSKSINFELSPKALLAKNQLESQECYTAILGFFVSLFQRIREYEMQRIHTLECSKDKELNIIDFHLQTQSFLQKIIGIHAKVIEDVLENIL